MVTPFERVPQSYRRSTFTLRAFFYHLTLATGVFLLPAVLLSEWAARRWILLGIELYILFFLMAWTYAIGVTIDMGSMRQRTVNPRIRYRNPSGFQNHTAITLAHVITGFMMCEIAFSQISRHLYLSFGGFAAEQSGFWYWLRFGLDNVLGMLPASLAEIYNFKFSTVTPNALWSQTYVFLMSLLMVTYVLAGVLKTWGAARRTRMTGDTRVYEYVPVDEKTMGFGEVTAADFGGQTKYRLYRLALGLFSLLWVLPYALGVLGIAANRTPISLPQAWQALDVNIPLLVGAVFFILGLRRAVHPPRGSTFLAMFSSLGGWLSLQRWTHSFSYFLIAFFLIYTFFWRPFPGLNALAWLLAFGFFALGLIYRLGDFLLFALGPYLYPADELRNITNYQGEEILYQPEEDQEGQAGVSTQAQENP